MKVTHTHTRSAIITRFRDGDTVIIHVECVHCGSLFKEILRLQHIESYEPAGETKPMALHVAKVLTERFRGRIGYLIPDKIRRDKYRRIIGDILLDEELLSNLIVQQGLAWYGVGRSNPNASL